jgi:hypothetical protein
LILRDLKRLKEAKGDNNMEIVIMKTQLSLAFKDIKKATSERD